MQTFSIAPQDRKWLLRWLRCHLAVWSIIAALLMLGWITRSTGQSGEIRSDFMRTSDFTLTSATEVHLPTGWRRTSDGWQHTSNWLSSGKSINAWIAEQQSREPQWIQQALDLIRRTPPLTFALLQLTGITMVVVMTTKANPGKQP